MTMVVSRPSSSSYSKYKRTLKAPGAAVRISTKILQNSPELVQNPAVFRRNISADEKSSSDSGSKKSGSKIRRLKSRKIRTCRVEIFSRPSNLVWVRTRQGDYVRRDLMMEPSFLDKYDVRDQLGKGGFGTVYSGMRRKDGVGVALKHVAKSKVLTWDVINGQRVPQELTFLLNLQSVAGVVKLLDFYEREDSFIYVMEKPREHMDLFDYITNKTRLEEHLARTFFKQVVDIVVACSQAGVVHRDIKDENLVVDLDSLQLTLIDFGSAGFTQDKDFRKYDGTRVYSPPEWISSGRYQWEGLTVWSLGVLLYDMVVGDVPWQDDDEIVTAKVKLPRDLSLDCRQLVRACLKVEEQQRITLTQIQSHRWLAAPDEFQ